VQSVWALVGHWRVSILETLLPYVFPTLHFVQRQPKTAANSREWPGIDQL
jgi:hypothetical protein